MSEDMTDKTEWPQWLRDAKTESARVEIINGRVIWRDGVWRGGDWRDGDWHGGIWHGGYWRGGYWRGGYWRGGYWYGGIWYDGDWRDGVWRGGYWRGGDWHGGIWRGGDWRGGDWHGGIWHGGKSSPTRCKWIVGIDGRDRISIGCESRTVAEWDAFFASDDVIETPRDTEAFRLIHRAYMAARAAVLFDTGGADALRREEGATQ